MDNVVHLQAQKREKIDPKANFKVALNTPLNLSMAQTQEPEPKRKKPNVFSRLRWKLKTLRKFVFNATVRPTRDYFYRREGDKLLGELVTLAIKLNRPDFHVFVHLSGHVESIKVDVYPGGWKKEYSTHINVLDRRLPGRGQNAKMRPQDLREAMNMMRSLSKLNRLHRR